MCILSVCSSSNEQNKLHYIHYGATLHSDIVTLGLAASKSSFLQKKYSLPRRIVKRVASITACPSSLWNSLPRSYVKLCVEDEGRQATSEMMMDECSTITQRLRSIISKADLPLGKSSMDD